MRSARSVQLTWLAIRYSLVPPCDPAGAKSAVSSHGSPTRLRALLADLPRHQDRHGRLDLHLPGVHPAAAPAIMFRLKRTGWSAGRVTVSSHGLRVTARR